MQVGLEKRYVYVRTLDRGTKHTERIPILAKQPEGLQISEISSKLPGVSGRVLKETDKDGKPKHVLEVTIDASTVGRLNGTLEMKTNHPKVPKLQLRISGEVVGNIRATPRQAYLRAPKGGPDAAAPTTKVRVTAAKGNFRVRKVEDSTGRVQAKFTTLKAGSEYQVELSLGPKAGTKYFKADVTVYTDSREQPTVVIPVSFRPRLGRTQRKPGLGGALRGRKPGQTLRLGPGSSLRAKPGGMSRPTTVPGGIPGADRMPRLPLKGSTTGKPTTPPTSQPATTTP